MTVSGIQRPSFSLKFDNLAANVLAGLIVSLVAIVFNLSYAALIFSGPLASYLPFGISASLISLIVSATLVTFFSSLPILCGGPDALTATVTALIVGNTAQIVVASGATEALLPTTLVTFVLATTLTGLVLFFAGQIQLGKWVRYIPYPVIGGFLAGTGWLITRGSIKVMSGVPLEIGQLDNLFRADTLWLWLPGVGLGLLTFAITRRYKHHLIIPALVLCAIVIFYLFLWVLDINLQQAATMGLLFEPFSETAYRFPLTGATLANVQWLAIWAQGATFLALFLITIIDLLLVASGLELAVESNVDFNRELRVTGGVNIVGGLLGGFVSCLSTSRTLLNYRAGATGRAAGLVVAIVGILMLLYGGPLIAYIPRPLLGGLLFYLGLSLLVRWLYEAQKKLSGPDYALIWMIVLVMGFAGLLPGISLGIVIASVIFTITYSQAPILRHDLTGADYPSNRARTQQQRRFLNENGHKIRILWLQGYLFFGTATQLGEHIQRLSNRQEDSEPAECQYLILDFQHVSGVDASAMTSFAKLQRLAEEHQVHLLYTSLAPKLLAQFIQEKIVPEQVSGEDDQAEAAKSDGDLLDGLLAELRPKESDLQYIFTDLDHGIEWCENQLLEPTHMRRQRFMPLALQLDELFPDEEQVTRFMSYLKKERAKKEQVLIDTDEQTTAIYILEHGQVSIFTQLENDVERRVATLGAGAIFGVWSVPANGYVVTNERSQLYLLSASALEAMEEEAPDLAVIFFRAIAHYTGEHLLLANLTIDRLLS